MSQSYYLFIVIATIAFPLAFTWDKRMSYYKKWRSLWMGIGLANLLFIPWDMIFTFFGVWGFNDKYHFGYTFLHLPLEEWAWFFVTPYACYFIYESMVYFVRERKWRIVRSLHIYGGILLIVSGIVNYQKAYTSLTFILAGALLLWSIYKWPGLRWGYFWMSYLVCLIPFLIFNGALTGAFTQEPVVWYNNAENLGIRIITIPIEDSIYLLLYLLLIYQVYGPAELRSPTQKKPR